MRYIARNARRCARLATRDVASAVQHLTGGVEHDGYDRRLTRQTAHRGGREWDAVGGLTQRMLVQPVEQRVVVDVDADLRHPPLPGPFPRHRRNDRVSQELVDRCARVPVTLFDRRQLGVDRRPQFGVTLRIERQVGVVHAGGFVDPAPHRHRCFLCGRALFRRRRRPIVCPAAGSDARTPPPAPPAANPNKSSANPAKRSRPASSSPRAALATASTWPADTTPSASAASNPGIASHTSERSDTARGLTARTTPMTRQHLRRRLRTTLGSELSAAAGDRHIDRVDPAPHPLRQAHHTRQTGPITTRQVDRQQRSDCLADTTILHHQTPFDHKRSTRGKPDANHPKQGVSQDREQG